MDNKELSAEEVLTFLRKVGVPESSLWSQIESRLLKKVCNLCLVEFRPRRVVVKNPSRKSVESRSAFNRRLCCSKSCSKKLKNPMHTLSSRQKMISSLKRIGHKPPRLYGNGLSLTPTQISIHSMLDRRWKTEVSVRTGVPNRSTFPYCYKIDIANESEKIGIEIDGSSHYAIERKKLDKKKDEFLSSIGWTIYRISDKKAEDLLRSCKSGLEILRSLQYGAPKEVRR